MSNGQIISGLAAKKAALYHKRSEIQAEADRKIAELDLEIKKIDDACKVINDVIEGVACPRCHGNGDVRHCDAAGDIEYIECPVCHGTGVKIKTDKEEY